jgi:hypothetical protein
MLPKKSETVAGAKPEPFSSVMNVSIEFRISFDAGV